jgi:hypothetical protein
VRRHALAGGEIDVGEEALVALDEAAFDERKRMAGAPSSAGALPPWRGAANRLERGSPAG